MKKLIKLAYTIFTVLAFSIIIMGVSKVNAATTLIHYIVTNPGEDASSQIRINYHAFKTGSFVEYTLASDTAYASATKVTPSEELWNIRSQKNGDPKNTFYTTDRYVCKVEINNLEKCTKYKYHVVCGEEVSADYYFTTAGLTNTWNFLAFADFQYGKNKVSHNLIKKMLEIGNDPALVVCSGDMTDVSGDEEEWKWFLDNDVFTKYTYATAPGDHEYWATYTDGTTLFDSPYVYNAMFNNPQNGAEGSVNSNFYFYYNNVLFVAIDLLDSDTVTSTKMTKEINWFKETMDRLAGTYQYLVVMGHKSIYSSYSNDSRVFTTIRPQWYPVFDTYAVDLVISGHDHMYSRTYKLYNGKVTSNSADERKKGTYYLDLGSSGDKTRVPDEKMKTDGLHECVLDLKSLGYSCGANVEVSDAKMVVSIYNQYGTVVDNFTIFSKRSAPAIELTGFDRDALLNDASLTMSSFASKTGTLSFETGEMLKYVNHIKVLNGEEVCLDQKINFSAQTYEYHVSNMTSLDYTVVFSMNDGTEISKEVKCDYFPAANIKFNDKEKLYLSWNAAVASLEEYSWKVYEGDKLVKELSNNDLTRAKIALSNEFLVGNHEFRIDLVTNGKVVDSYKVEYKGHDEVSLTSNSIDMAVGEKAELDYEFAYDELIEVKVVDSSIVSYANAEITALKKGSTDIIFTIKDTDISYKCTVNVGGKSGCNAASATEIIGLITTLAIALFLKKGFRK